MNPLEKLRARLKQIGLDMNAIVTEAEAAEDGLLTDAQQESFDALEAEHKKVASNVTRLESMAKIDADTNSGTGRRSAPVAAPAAAASARIETIENEDPMAGFHDMADFAHSVHQASIPGGSVDDRLSAMMVNADPSNFHRESGGGTEGYEVPPEMRRTIWSLVYEDDTQLMNMVDSEPTNSNSVEFLADESTPWGGGANSILATWAAEGKKMNPSKFEENAEAMKLHKLYAMVLATDELMDDAPRLANRLTQKAATAINWKVNESVMSGTGVGQPLGYRKSKAVITVAKEGGQGANTIEAMNIANMFARMLPSSLPRAMWLANSDILPQLMTMKIGDNLIWTPPSSGMTQAPGGLLLGRPLHFTEHAETLGTEGDLQLIDPKGYYMARKKGGIKLATSIHLYFDFDMQAFRWTFRIGGQPYLSKPVTPPKSNKTKSHFVTLAARA